MVSLVGTPRTTLYKQITRVQDQLLCDGGVPDWGPWMRLMAGIAHGINPIPAPGISAIAAQAVPGMPYLLLSEGPVRTLDVHSRGPHACAGAAQVLKLGLVLGAPHLQCGWAPMGGSHLQSLSGLGVHVGKIGHHG